MARPTIWTFLLVSDGAGYRCATLRLTTIATAVNSVTAQNAAAASTTNPAGTKRTAEAADTGDQKRAKTENNGNATSGDKSADS